MDLQPKSATAEQQPEAQWFLNAAKPELIYAGVNHLKEIIESNHPRFETQPMSTNSQLVRDHLLVREMFLAGESMHVENFVKSYNDDALYQFSMQGLPAPIDRRKEIDGIFLELLTRDAFAPRMVYYWVVRIFGGLFFHVYTRHKRRYKGCKVRL